MRILIVHNAYRSDSPSGEQRVVEDDIAALRAAGCEVELYQRSSDEIADLPPLRRAELVVRPVYSREDSGRLRRLLAERRPDVMHLHNPYPLISPWVVRVAAHAGVPVVQTVHNYRMVCMNGVHFRDGAVCTDCVGRRVPWPGARHGCYRGSRAQSLVMTAALTAHRGTWQLVSRYLALTGFMRDHLVAAGIDPARVTVRPNTIPDPGATPGAGDGVLFAGRLVPEKGVLDLVEAWRSLEPSRRPGTLTIAGDGPLRADVEAVAAAEPDVRVLGAVPPAEVDRLMRASAAVAVPSRWYEGFPMTVLEAFARGRPVLAGTLGSLGSVVDDEVGWRCAGGPAGLRDALAAVTAAESSRRGTAARARYESAYAPDVVYGRLLTVYRELAPTAG